MTDQELIDRATEAMQYSYSPYSHFRVGAALLTADGRVYTGCNIENSSFSVTNCAERTALFKAVSEGVHDFQAIAVVGGTDGDRKDFSYPCGVCRQALTEFCGPDFRVILGKADGEIRVHTLEELLTGSFTLREVLLHEDV
ncbi:MAG: cytidine deaminase [Lachnospiraceae bacterium]|nr:cytidine deaminase [Lachnospiraceae bacterium]